VVSGSVIGKADIGVVRLTHTAKCWEVGTFLNSFPQWISMQNEFVPIWHQRPGETRNSSKISEKLNLIEVFKT
jgi:hypothetical protein